MRNDQFLMIIWVPVPLVLASDLTAGRSKSAMDVVLNWMAFT